MGFKSEPWTRVCLWLCRSYMIATFLPYSAYVWGHYLDKMEILFYFPVWSRIYLLLLNLSSKFPNIIVNPFLCLQSPNLLVLYSRYNHKPWSSNADNCFCRAFLDRHYTITLFWFHRRILRRPHKLQVAKCCS